jgi:xanthine dehydrogenase accessory factor
MLRPSYDWAGAARVALEAGEPCALISILAVEGSTPREAGTRMAVTRRGCVGTIGGGNLEFQAVGQARLALDQPPGAWRIQDYPLGPFLNQCCGGRVRLLVERLDAVHAGWLADVHGRPAYTLETRLHTDHVERALTTGAAPALPAKGAMPAAGDTVIEGWGGMRTPLLMFGAGHVGMAIARVMEGLPFDLRWHDSREDTDAPHASAPAMAAMAAAAPGVVLILTHDHALDYELTKAALGSPARFIGLIGSATKRARFFGRLAREGFGDADLARIHCPVGLPGITGKTPDVIAVAVAAQLLLECK